MISNKIIQSKTELIELCVGIIKISESNIYSKSPEYIRDKINEIWGFNVTEEEVILWFEPTIDEEIKDLQLQYQNLI